MALEIKQLQNYSWMAQASYLNLQGLKEGDIDGVKEKLTSSNINIGNQFSFEQAEIFTGSNTLNNYNDGFSFIHHQENTSGEGTSDEGFSATVFKSNENGSYTIAVRGTEPGNDPENDIWGMVEHIQDYEWSSYAQHAGLAESWIDLDQGYLSLSVDEEEWFSRYKQYVAEAGTSSESQLINKALQRGQLTGSNRFIEDVERRLGRRIETKGPARPRREAWVVLK